MRAHLRREGLHARDRAPGPGGPLDHLRPRAGDILVVWKLDRFGRSVEDVLVIAEDLHARGIDLRTSTGTLAAAWVPTGEGKFFFAMMAAFGELERDMIHERTMAGLAASRRQGRTGGRPSVMDDDEVAAAKARRAARQSPTQIAKALGISRATVHRHLGATGAPSEERFTGVAPSAPVKQPGLDVPLDLDRVAGARLEVVLLRARARPGARRCRRSRRGCV